MPLYEYECASCGHVLDVRHGFDETYNEPCPRCGGVVNRRFNPAGIVFKGSGFYVTDSRNAERAKAESSSAKSKTPEKSTTEAPASAETKSEKPAPTTTGEGSAA